ncbi:hypothetical protein PUNSTDRAFT_136867 [Punctularia strigosozonata HHB-11173 SS5]|uniref:uncharacterized protein n=1 Tax=Punctularia strigosozonata (strain HHB-11173) TaxID=741275 RepID=UPI000441728E|nr:uncharacterized protein PUNSTDRAFT_136867 [Punctularia strigosozonata HHB-11173 SS5]EIN06072.1 hypothetical protein PUNSTDRAFT_136867 [Punctularia strigosozonata HHB-11173 SS5]
MLAGLAIFTSPCMEYLEFTKNYTALGDVYRVYEKEVADAISEEARALDRILGLMSGTIEGDADDLERAEWRFSNLRSLHMLEGVSVVMLRRKREAAAVADTHTVDCKVDRSASPTSTSSTARAPRVDFKLRLPALPKLPSSSRRLRRMTRLLRGSNRVQVQVLEKEAEVLAKLQALIDHGVSFHPEQVADRYAARYGDEYYMFVIKALARRGCGASLTGTVPLHALEGVDVVGVGPGGGGTIPYLPHAADTEAQKTKPMRSRERDAAIAWDSSSNPTICLGDVGAPACRPGCSAEFGTPGSIDVHASASKKGGWMELEWGEWLR